MEEPARPGRSCTLSPPFAPNNVKEMLRLTLCFLLRQNICFPPVSRGTRLQPHRGENDGEARRQTRGKANGAERMLAWRDYSC